MRIKTFHNQNILDVCLQHTGSLSELVELAVINNLSITSEALPNSLIVVGLTQDNLLASFYRDRNHLVATGFAEIKKESFEFPLEFPISF